MKERYERFEELLLYGIPQYSKIKKVLAVKIADAQSNPVRWYNAFGGLFYFLKESLLEERVYKKVEKDNSNFLLFYGKYNLRKDHQKTFLGFADRFQDADACYADFRSKKKITLFRFFANIFLLFIWLFQMLFHRIPLLEALNALPYVLLCYDTRKVGERLLEKSYKFVVVYYDASPDENFFVQMCQNRKLLTMTLQHGIFARKSVIHTITDTAFELSESISDYYLAWNQYTKDEAIKVGLEPDRIIVLGAPKYINTKEPSEICKADNHVFGVILNNSAFDKHNRCLIEMANQINQITGLKYILRYHPQMGGSEYKSMYNEGYLKSDDNSHSIREYAQEVSFTIISSSSVFVDLLLLKHPTYRLKVTPEDTYSTVPFNCFSTVDELIELRNNPTDINIAFTYLCNSYTVYKNYRSFFDGIIDNK